MHSQALEELFMREVEEMYDAEKQIYSGLGQLSRNARNPDLKSAFETHRKETKGRIGRLEKTFALLGEKRRRGRSPGVSGLLREARDLAGKHDFDPAVIDAGLIAGAQKIEHYGMAAYGCLRTHAGLLGYRQIEQLFGESIQEEARAGARLDGIAQKEVNADAAAAPYAQARTGPRHSGNGHVRDAEGGKIGLGKVVLGLMVGGALSLLLKAPRPVVR
jgi:ferritin-like metal-binding protein YciE